MITGCVVLCLLAPAAALQAMLEKFEQINGTDIIDTHIRVRKINRTTAALFGNSSIEKVLDNDYVLSVVADHSPLGNNQFNRYPMKIGPLGWCEFMEKFWPEYYPYGIQYVTNLWKPEDCPTQPMKPIIFNDFILDPKIFPPYLPKGLWRMEITLSQDSVTVLEFRFLIKIYDDGYF